MTASAKTVMLSGHNLVLNRGPRLIVSGVNFSLTDGVCLWIKGANGSGKSSLLSAIAGSWRPIRGEFRLNGQSASELKRGEHTSWLGHRNALLPKLTVEETIYHAQFHGLSRSVSASNWQRFGLDHIISCRVEKLSAGERKRLALFRLYHAFKPIWALDEPEAALDQAGHALLESVGREHLLNRGIIVIASHHQPQWTVSATIEL